MPHEQMLVGTNPAGSPSPLLPDGQGVFPQGVRKQQPALSQPALQLLHVTTFQLLGAEGMSAGAFWKALPF